MLHTGAGAGKTSASIAGFGQDFITTGVNVQKRADAIVSPDARCLPSERRVQWSVVGPAGPAGRRTTLAAPIAGAALGNCRSAAPQLLDFEFLFLQAQQ